MQFLAKNAASRATSRSSVLTRARGTQRVGAAVAAGNEGLWLPAVQRPEWLDGSLPGDRGFDPLGLSRPNELVQIGVDDNDINAQKNLKGGVDSVFTPERDVVEPTPFAPYSEVFGLQRFRENELIHGRWAMLACLGVFVAEGTTGVSWYDAGKVELDGAVYAGFSLPFNMTQLLWIEAVLVGGAEVYRNSQLDPETRLYPGGAFDPLNFASPEQDPEKVFKLKTAEIKHGRLAMVAFLGFATQAFYNDGAGAFASAIRFTDAL